MSDRGDEGRQDRLDHFNGAANMDSGELDK